MNMTPEAFHIWCQRFGLTSETEALLASIRSSPPVRRVNSRVGNITGRFPSPKMGVSNGLRYYHPLMRASNEAGKQVEVRYEPFNMGICVWQ